MPCDPAPPDHAPYGPLPEGGTIRRVVRWGDDVMHRPALPVTTYDEGLRALVADMVATMYAADGVGLAACQIGVDLAVFCFDCHDESGERTVGVVCNPVVTLPEGRDRRLDEDDEGCLSLPGAYVPLARPDVATCIGTGLDGMPVEFSGDSPDPWWCVRSDCNDGGTRELPAESCEAAAVAQNGTGSSARSGQALTIPRLESTPRLAASRSRMKREMGANEANGR